MERRNGSISDASLTAPIATEVFSFRLVWRMASQPADWGVADPILSDRDRKNPARADIESQWQPHWRLRP